MEVLLVAAMTAVIGLAVFNAFSNGFKLWARGEHLIVESDIAIFLDKLGGDLRGVQPVSAIAFQGIGTQMSFPTTILAPTDKNGSRAAEQWGSQIGAVQYEFDVADQKIYRRQANYGQALKGQWQPPEVVASLIDDVSFQYYFASDRGLSVKSLADDGIPAGVMVDVAFEVQGQERHMRRYFSVPVGGGL